MKTMRLFSYLGLGLLTLALTSCFEEDEPVPPYISPPGVTTTVAEMGPLYGVQLFYDLQSNQFVRTVDRQTWDLAFQCGAEDYHIFLNDSKLMKVGRTGTANWNAVTSTDNVTWKWDHSEGWEDSTAIGPWGQVQGDAVVSANLVYVVDRGITTQGNNIGYRKLQVIGLQNNTYTIRFANLDGSDEHTLSFAKDDNYNYIFVSLTGAGATVPVEPPKSEWDLQFTQYTALVTQQGTGIVENYSVNGVLLNAYKVKAAREFSKPFEQIVYSDLSGYNFTTQRDIIGYEWKEYDFDLSTYIIYPNQVYLVQDVEGNYYKMRFTSFTNDQGIRGYPTVEIARF